MSEHEPIPQDWLRTLAGTAGLDALQAAQAFVAAEERAGKTVYPPAGARFAAMRLTPPDAVKVVILGQDPYHGPGQAHGLAFSVAAGVRPPPSLGNIYKELESDLGIARPRHGNLETWARQGVLLLNTTLTVEAAKAGSHQRAGWAMVTDMIVDAVARRAAPSVFMLWGNHARQKAARIAAEGHDRHLVLVSAHPSPLSARHGFFGSRPFSQANAFLEAHERGAIDWRP